MSATKQRTPWLIYAFGALAELLFGYDTGIIGVAMLSIHGEFDLTPAEQGFVVSSLLLGAAIGVGTAGRLADRLGRKPVILITGIVFAVGGLVAALAPSVVVLVIARLVMGLGVGASAVVVSVYLVEVAPTRHRGKIGSLGQLAVVTGVLVAYLVGYGLQPSGDWRLMLGLSIAPALILVVGLALMPETPRWLVAHGRSDDARSSLGRLGRPDTASIEVADLERAHAADARSGLSTGEVIRRMFAPAVRSRTWAAIGLAVLVQFVGTNSILYFAPTTLVHAGFGETAAVTANLSVGVANVLFTLLGMTLVDRIPRRRLLTIGTIGMIAAMGALSIYTTVEPDPSPTGAWVTLVSMIVFLSAFALSWGVCVRVVISELFPSAIRGTAAGLVLVLNWLANFVVGQTFPSLLAFSGALSFAIFAVVGVLALVFIGKMLPETGDGRSLEEVDERA
ncbi:sugar porter family MFS transporter [Curtobacterium sp. MCSS17_015]|uniref:sugar porter family MFS transporter n=1 Tax=Curtobacterium sp. MCSS17_015 TaxID=2175666 RepID=UPI0021AD43AA|nr:sugar porter family MFS transporter [Curtobacterium sp. MCSS17_015]WIB28083.1 sugar porter family MFS transporter [Curtobacterium sp. MCSS17_015]